MIGASISHYRITDELGRGGMGIVYRAEDERLDRTVALKLLPPHALSSEEDRARFYREARAAAALSHPNIAHVYEIDESVVAPPQTGTTPGSGEPRPDAEKRPFIAMEFIEGETLSDYIAKRPVPIKDALSIATQIAEGLKAAHEKNIVHRDVKSGNIMITSDGVVKILDFGLAKTTASTKLTQMGSTLGTVAYMSPEQAKGDEVDRRSDIWSLGVILYEMIGGQLPFKGDYEQAVVYGILNEDPESLTSLRAGVPLAFDGISAKLLAKDPDLRYQHVDELPADLKAIDLASVAQRTRITTSAATIAATAAVQSDASVRRSVAPRLLVGSLAVGVLLGAVGVWAAVRAFGPASAETRAVHLNLTLPQMDVEGRPAWSSDGSKILFTANDGAKTYIAEYDLLTGTTRTIPGTATGTSGRYSPDGRTITFKKETDLYRVSEGATQPVLVSDSVFSSRVRWFSPTELVFARAIQILRHDLATDEVDVIVPADSAKSWLWGTTLSRDGNYLFFNRQLNDGMRGFVRDLRSSSERALERGIIPKDVTGNGYFVYFALAASSIMARPMNLGTAEFEGGAVALTSAYNVNEMAVSASGNLMYRPYPGGEAATGQEPMYWVGPQGGLEVIGMIDAAEANDFVLARDGRTAVIEARVQEDDYTLFSFDLTSKAAVRLLPVAPLARPELSGDGRTVYFDQIENGTGRIRRVPLDGLRNAEDVVATDFDDRNPSVTADEKVLVFERHDPNTGWDIWSKDLVTGSEQVLVAADGDQTNPDISPDGRLISFQSVVGGQYSVLVGEIGARGFVEVATGVENPQWSFDGDRLYFSDLSRRSIFFVSVSAGPPLSIDIQPRVAFELLTADHIHFAPAPGDSPLLVSFVGAAGATSEGAQWNVVLNWTAELEKRVPRTK